MCVHNPGDRVLRVGSIEVYTVTQGSMGLYCIEDRNGHVIRQMPGAYLLTPTEALVHFVAGLCAVAAELGDPKLLAIAGEVSVSAVIAKIQPEPDDEAVA